MPDSIIALKSRSGEIFRRMIVLHRELRDANFYVVNLSDKQKQRNSIIATEIQALVEENNAILNEIDFYKKNGFVRKGMESQQDEIDYSKLTIKEINKLLRNNQSYLCRARADLLKLTDEIKKIQKANRIKNLMQVQEELREEINRR